MMDAATAQYYAAHAAAVALRYESVASPLARYFGVAFPTGARVLDVGAGSGRDLAALLAAGYDAWGVEPVEALAAAALAHHPELSGRLVHAALPALGEPFGGGFDGIVCSAVLMHVPRAELFDAALALRALLRAHGRLLLSLPLVRADLADSGRDPHGRLFEPYAPDEVQLLFERLGFGALGRWDRDDALGRTGTRWCTLLLERRTGGALRAVDQIEAILNRDRKVATYKLALFRALAELATQEPRVATWCADGQVAVPIRRLAEKWLEYYWPILAAERFVPQSAAEGAGAAQPLKFRAALRALMQPYAGRGEHGGLAAWWLDRARGRVGDDYAPLQAALRAITAALRDGPVRYSGGALDTGAVFAFDARTGQVRMHADLWRELALLGHWITDAVVLRWAALTERFGQRAGVRAAEVLPLLLARPEPARATDLARSVYQQHAELRCTWSGVALLAARFEVDHVIPFALWGSNDLWNLLPVAAPVNRDKSDRLPAAELLVASRARVIDGWEKLREALPEPFDRQAAHLLGRPVRGGAGWHDELFGRLREAIELTALQRGVERWTPRPRTTSAR